MLPYVLDRTDALFCVPTSTSPRNWAEKVDMKTGRPVKVPEHSPLKRAQYSACPSAMAARTSSRGVDPSIRQFLCATTTVHEDNLRTLSQHPARTVYVFANVYMYPEKPGCDRQFKKFNVVPERPSGKFSDQYPNWGGALVTAADWRSTAASAAISVR